MKRFLIATGSAGLLIALVGGYSFQLVVKLASAIPGSNGDSYNTQAWVRFIACCLGLALAVASTVALLFRGGRKSE